MPAILVHGIAQHAAAAGHLTARGGWRFLPGGLAPPNPPAKAPPGLAKPVKTIIGWSKWAVLVCGVIGLLICGGKMTIGHRNRATFAADGATGIPWVLGGLSLAAVSAAIVGVFL